MESHKCFFLLHVFSLSFLILGIEAYVCAHKQSFPLKLFVFGDSYADTGNLGKLGPDFTRSWYEPYGMTFPRKPTGRFSDGRILTDYFASFLGTKSPIAYKYWKLGFKLLRYGMNFAVGGAGIFDTGNFQKNLGAQIDNFEELINEGIFSKCDVESSVALVSIAGNDYEYHMETNPHGNLTLFVKDVTTQLTLDLKRIHDLGVRKVVVTNLHPLECTPFVTRDDNYKKCEEGVINMGVVWHNSELEQAMKKLLGANRNSTFLTLDLYTAFLSVIHQEPGARKFEDVLKPCCKGIGNNSFCGQLDEHGVKRYKLCHEPDNSFYWDAVHPTQAGWAAVFELLKPSLKSFFFPMKVSKLLSVHCCSL